MCQRVPLGAEPIGLGRARRELEAQSLDLAAEPVALGGEVVSLTREVIELPRRVGRLRLELGAKGLLLPIGLPRSGEEFGRAGIEPGLRDQVAETLNLGAECVAFGTGGLRLARRGRGAQVPLEEVFELLLELDGTHLGLGEPVLDGL